MPALEASHEPTLFDQHSQHSELLSPANLQDAALVNDAELAAPPIAKQVTAAGELEVAESAANANAETTETPEETAQSERKRLELQLDALKRKESEIRRALAVADHPELAEAIRVIEGRAYALAKADAKLAQGLSKGEARRREAIEKKLGTLREKRSEIDSQITELETEFHGLGTERLAGFEAERREALEQLLIAVASNDAALSAAGLEAEQLVPDLARWLPEVEGLAKQLDAAHPSA
jgi:chromosome segregation ATPase